jgi:hypothetical protein
MPHIELEMQTSLPPEKVIAALTDFSDRRPDLWPGLWREAYQVYEVGDTWAEVREGSKRPNIWARERYDWSTPGTVRWEVIESNFCTPGSFVQARVTPLDEGGSRVHITWERTGTRLASRLMLAFVALTRGAPVKSSVNAGFKRQKERQP